MELALEALRLEDTDEKVEDSIFENETNFPSEPIIEPKTEEFPNFDRFLFKTYGMVCLISLVEGILGLCLLAYFYIYYYHLKATPCQLAILQGVSSLPWVAKPLLGMLTDRVSFLGYHKRSYIFCISFFEVCLHISIFKFNHSFARIVICNILQVACIAFRNAIGGR